MSLISPTLVLHGYSLTDHLHALQKLELLARAERGSKRTEAAAGALRVHSVQSPQEEYHSVRGELGLRFGVFYAPH
jgi:hypothetical protein